MIENRCSDLKASGSEVPLLNLIVESKVSERLQYALLGNFTKDQEENLTIVEKVQKVLGLYDIKKRLRAVRYKGNPVRRLIAERKGWEKVSHFAISEINQEDLEVITNWINTALKQYENTYQGRNMKNVPFLGTQLSKEELCYLIDEITPPGTMTIRGGGRDGSTLSALYNSKKRQLPNNELKEKQNTGITQSIDADGYVSHEY